MDNAAQNVLAQLTAKLNRQKAAVAATEFQITYVKKMIDEETKKVTK